MSRDASLALFKAVRSALIADATIVAAVGQRVSTDWGAALEAPFMRLSIPTVRQFEDDAGDGSEYTLRVHVWTREPGPILSAGLAAQVREALQDKDLAVDGAALWWLTYDQTISVQDADDPTLRMAVVTFKAVTTNS